MTTCAIQTTNPVDVEVGVQYHLPEDGNWIPTGFDVITFTLDAQDLEDDYYASLEDAATAWCKSNGFSFVQLIEEP